MLGMLPRVDENPSEKPDKLEVVETSQVVSDSAQELANLRSEVEEFDHVESPKSPLDEALDLLQQKHPTVPSDRFYRAVVEEMGAIGVDAKTVESNVLILPDLLSLIEARLIEEAAEMEAANARGIEERLLNLKASGVSLSESLKTIRSEFSGQIDPETDVVISKFEALFSAKMLPVQKERQAVETLFFSTGVADFTPAVFTGFVVSIYEQPDSVISKQTKARIEEKFQIPRQTVSTGQELRSLAFARDEEGNLLHGSPDTAIQFQAGMSSYVQPDGQAVVTVNMPNAPKRTIFVQAPENWSGRASAESINYGLLRYAVYDELDQTAGLFGGQQEESEFGEAARKEAAKRANRFYGLLIGGQNPDQLVQEEGVGQFRAALRALANPGNQSEEENIADLRDLGVLDGSAFDWGRIREIGAILRRNHFFQAQGTRNPLAPHLLLRDELRQLDRHEDD